MRLIPLAFVLLFSAMWGLSVQAQNLDNRKSNYVIGIEAYQNGDFKRAFDAWILGAYEGSADAQYNLAIMYLEGKSLTQDAVRAKTWFEMAATQNHAEAQYNLGHMALKGLGGDKSIEQALSWWRQAANGNYAQAQFNYGRAVYLGIDGIGGTNGSIKLNKEPNKAQGIAYIKRAAAQGEPRAIAFLAKAQKPNPALETARLSEPALPVYTLPAATLARQSVESTAKPETPQKGDLQVIALAEVSATKSAAIAVKKRSIKAALPEAAQALPSARKSSHKKSVAGVEVIKGGSLLRRDYFLRSADKPTRVYSDSAFSHTIDTLSPNALVRVVDKQSNKLKIEIAAGLPAWVKRKDVILQDGYASTFRGRAKLYVQGNEASLLAGILPMDLKAKILVQQPKWLQIRVPMIVFGWIPTTDLEYKGEPAQALYLQWALETQAMVKAAKMPRGLMESIVPKVGVQGGLKDRLQDREARPIVRQNTKSASKLKIKKSVLLNQFDNTKVAMNDNAWLFAQNKGAHVIHLFTMDDQVKAIEISRSAEFKASGHLYSTQIKQQTWAFLLLGPYPNAESALAEKARLPRKFKKWSRVRDIALIAGNRCKKRRALTPKQANKLNALCP